MGGPVPRIEEPSAASRKAADAVLAKKMKASDWEKPKLPELREKEAQAAAKAAAGPKKRKGPKGANPLSCRKAKAPKAQPVAQPQVRSAPMAQAADGVGPGRADEPSAPVKKKRVRTRRGGGGEAEAPVVAETAAPSASASEAAAAAAQTATDESGAVVRGKKRQRT